ncbi:MAG: ATP-dependent DNA helicase [Methanoregula sp.]|nr:ATP-dependent DNA helicase [Methanoregula sp.]
MDAFETYFPYEEYRPLQRGMLEFAAQCARDGGIAMIDAPTGSGKSSVVAALLAERKGKKVLIAVRTKSQLATFIRELALIKKKQPQLRVAYLMGKAGMCPLGGQGDVYRRCKGVKTFSISLMRDRAEKGALVPTKDPFILQQIRRMDRDHPLICPYFIHSRVFVQGDAGGVKMVPSATLRTRADRVIAEIVPPQDLGEFSHEICPYELMMHAARNADVIILNYHHLFDRMIREQLYLSIGIKPQDVLLLIDEAHNCGEVIQSIERSVLKERDLEQASRELLALRRRHKGVDAVQHVLPRLTDFIAGLKNSTEPEDWFDPVIFDRMVVRSSLYKDMDEILDDLMHISDLVREKNQKAGEYRETAIERLTTFLFRLNESARNPAYLTVYHWQDEEIALEVRNIDPSSSLQDICGSHSCSVLISGTLSPVESFRRYFFEDATVTTLTLSNAFPKQNRLVLCATEITTAFSMRQNQKNTTRIEQYIKTFATLQGNLAIYFPSYQILDRFAKRCAAQIPAKQIFIEPREASDATTALAEFLALPQKGKSGLLFAVCGGKWSEGLDYRGEMLSGAMVIGLPLAPYNRVRRMVIDYFRRKFGTEGEFLCYTLPAINRALQALGRVLRSPSDRGVLVLGERRFLEPGIRYTLPLWLQKEMIECDALMMGREITGWIS